jgi:lipopolysaccharide transport protein LptA
MRRAEPLLALVAGCALAAAAGEAPVAMNVNSDHGEFDLAAGRAHHWGNVSFTRGNARIEADDVVLELADGKLERATISGGPARFTQAAAVDAPAAEGSARRMTYDAGVDQIELEGEARVVQGGDEVTGDLIRYDARRQRVLAASGSEGSGRVQMTITPKRSKEPDAEAPPR